MVGCVRCSGTTQPLRGGGTDAGVAWLFCPQCLLMSMAVRLSTYLKGGPVKTARQSLVVAQKEKNTLHVFVVWEPVLLVDKHAFPVGLWLWL